MIPLYGWAAECETRFGTHPVQICQPWNTAVHRAEFEARPQRRALTRPSCRRCSTPPTITVDEIRRRGRKGWVAAFRDAAMVKIAYAFGLRRRELVRLDVHDFGRNPKAAEFGEFGVCYVRFGKASRGQPTEAAQRADGDAVVGGGARAVGRRGVAALPHATTARVVAVGEVAPGEREPVHDQRSPGCANGRAARRA